MPTIIGHVEAIFRYPVKSMAGERLEAATLGWHGLEGDRRLALRRLEERGGFPWLSASRLPELVRFAPLWLDLSTELPSHVRTPSGAELPVFGDELAADIAHRLGAPVEMMQMRQGVLDDASLSVIATDTVHEIARLADQPADARRFRPNVLVRLLRGGAFQEDAWVGGALMFGDAADAPAIHVTQRDVRCSMVNFDPDTAASAPRMLKTVVQVHDNTAGVYGTVTRVGRIAVGQAVVI